MSLPNRKLWTIRLRDGEIERLKEAALIEEERPCTWSRLVLMREARRILSGAHRDETDGAA